MHVRLLALAMFACAFNAAAASAAARPTREQIEAERRDMVNDTLTHAWPYQVEIQRRLCFRALMPGFVVRARLEGDYFAPDAADSCVAALTRHGRDDLLETPYWEWLEELGADTGKAAGMPRTIAAAAMKGDPTIAIGSSKRAKLRPSVAFDAGFTVAYQDGAAMPPGVIAEPFLRVVTEACLADAQEVTTCYWVGFLYGARAHRQPVTPPR